MGGRGWQLISNTTSSADLTFDQHPGICSANNGSVLAKEYFEAGTYSRPGYYG